MTRKNRLALLLIMLILSSFACGQIEIGVEPSVPADTPTFPAKTAVVEDRAPEERQTNQRQPTNTDSNNNQAPVPVEGRLDCSQFGVDDLVSIACNIQASFTSRNISPLLSYMPPEFVIGYWLSEWTTVTPEYFLESAQNYWLPPNPDQMTFTTDPDQFPPMYQPIETMLGPEHELALVIYSEGWGEEGNGAVIIFITGNETAGYQFYAILISTANHFDMPPSGDGS